MGVHLPHLWHDKKEGGGSVGMPPKGCMTIKVGHEGGEQQRFVVPVMYLNHPLFMGLLKEAEEEYGFEQKGAITIPCDVEHFRHLRGIIDREGVPPRRVLQGLRCIGKKRGWERRKTTGYWMDN